MLNNGKGNLNVEEVEEIEQAQLNIQNKWQ